jgi:DNA-binding CsgD family transcriptional regulator
MPIIMQMIKKRIEHNQNCLIVQTGNPGSGKSYNSLRFGEVWSKYYGVPFTIQNVQWKPLEFLKNLNAKKYSKGSIIIFDETGAELNNRQWQQKTNILMGFVLQTFRYMNYIVIFNVPDLNFVDVTIRRLIHFHWETSGINYQKKVSYIKPFVIDNNQRTAKMYYKYLRYKHPHEKPKALAKVGFRLVEDAQLLADYERKKREYTNKLYKESEIVLTDLDINNDGTRVLTERQKEIYSLNQAGMNQDKIAISLGIDNSMVSRVLKSVERKGYIIRKFNRKVLQSDNNDSYVGISV